MADAAPETAGEELAALHPERELTVAGRAVTVRPIGFIEGARRAAQIAPIVEALKPMGEPDAPAPLAAIEQVVAEHVEVFLDLLALTTGEPRDWIAALDDADGQRLLLTFWSVNAPFFIRRMLLSRQTAAMLTAAAARAGSASPTSNSN